MYDPTQSVVVTLAIYSQKLSLSRLALYAVNVIAPQLEQVPGISFANVGGLVTPAYEVVVDPDPEAVARVRRGEEDRRPATGGDNDDRARRAPASRTAATMDST